MDSDDSDDSDYYNSDNEKLYDPDWEKHYVELLNQCKRFKFAGHFLYSPIKCILCYDDIKPIVKELRDDVQACENGHYFFHCRYCRGAFAVETFSGKPYPSFPDTGKPCCFEENCAEIWGRRRGIFRLDFRVICHPKPAYFYLQNSSPYFKCSNKPENLH